MFHVRRNLWLFPFLLNLSLALMPLGSKKASADWELPSKILRAQIIDLSEAVLNVPDMKIRQHENIFRIQVLEMDWDIGVMVYEPEETNRIPTGNDGKKAGIFLLHGGTGDYKSMEPLARTLSSKFGFKVVSMTYPGRLYFLDESRDWPGDTVNTDGTARTPLWSRETRITPDQYEIVRDTSKRAKYGTFIYLKARAGTEFYYRMAAWPVAFEEAMKEACRRHLPMNDFSIFVHGHSTGGPFAFIASQRVPNIAGVIGYGTHAFGYMYPRMGKGTWDFPFNYLRMRTWRDTARYAQQDLGHKGYSLPLLMELVFERWAKDKKRANFKAEDFVHKNAVKSLAQAARVTAERLHMNPKESEALVQRYTDYCRELAGPGVKPVPPVLFVSGRGDKTIAYEDYKRVILPLLSKTQPPPKAKVVLLEAGVHAWNWFDRELPHGIIPAVAKLWFEAIKGGYFVQ